jgi:hypothetical protein
MSFTDSMYTAIREFYFNGTPYPAEVGLPDSEAAASSTSETPSDGDAVNGGESDSDSDAFVGKGEQCTNASSDESSDDDDKDEFVGVHCFPGRPPTSVYVTNESPTIWFKPKEVWEVSCADFTLSRTHTAAAGLVDDPEGRGVALRFPRFKRRRPDKSVEEATTCAQIAQLFTQQVKQH